MARAVIIHVDDGPFVELISPYDEDLIQELKSGTPRHARKWDRDNRVWRVKSRYSDVVRSILNDLNYQILEVEPKAWPTNYYEKIHEREWKALHLQSGAPAEVVKAAFKALVRLHHPDAGGDTATMQRINYSFDKIMERLDA